MTNQEDRFIYKWCLTKEEIKELTQEIAESIAKENAIVDPPNLTREQAWTYLGIGKTLFGELHEAGEFDFIQYTPEGKCFYPIQTLKDFQERKLNKRL